MKLSHPSQSALLLSVLALAAEPCSAEEKTPSPARAQQNEGKPEPRRTPPGQSAREKAKHAQTRAREAKKAGKQLVAERLENAARIWEKVASHQEKAAKLEEDAANIERKTLDIKSQARRAHSLVEQTETRRARAVARLRELGLSVEPPPTQPEGTSDAKGSKPAESKAGPQ